MGEPALVDDDLVVRINPDKSEELRNFIDRIEKLEQDKAAIAEDIKAVKAAAKSDGWDVKTINRIIKLRSTDERTVQEEETLLDAYKRALGMG